MKKIIVFDLKNTLVTEKGEFVMNAQVAIQAALRSADKVVLYSMNEPWTYEMLSQYREEFQLFNTILLVSQKQESDLAQFQGNEVLVVGDSLIEEIAFGQEWGFNVVIVDGNVPVKPINAFLMGKL